MCTIMEYHPDTPRFLTSSRTGRALLVMEYEKGAGHPNGQEENGENIALVGRPLEHGDRC